MPIKQHFLWSSLQIYFRCIELCLQFVWYAYGNYASIFFCICSGPFYIAFVYIYKYISIHLLWTFLYNICSYTMSSGISFDLTGVIFMMTCSGPLLLSIVDSVFKGSYNPNILHICSTTLVGSYNSCT